nr:EamA family transporter [Nakamurella alba]
MSPTPAPARAGLLFVTLAAVLWGTTGVVVQVVHRDTGLGALSIGFWRLVVSALALLLVSLPRLGRLVEAARRHPVGLLLAGAGLAVYQALYFLSVVWSGVSVATMVSLGTAPVLTTLWEALRHRRSPGRRQQLVLVLALAGLLLIGLDHGETAGTSPGWGLVAALGSGTVYAATAVLSERLASGDPGVPAGVLTTAMSVVGAVVILPAALAQGIVPTAVDTRSVLGVVYIGVATTAIAYALFNAGLRTVPSSVASVLTLWEPLTAGVLAVVLLAEPLGLLTGLGSGLLLVAVVLLYLRPRGRTDQPEGVLADEATPVGAPAGLRPVTADGHDAPAPPTALVQEQPAAPLTGAPADRGRPGVGEESVGEQRDPVQRQP